MAEQSGDKSEDKFPKYSTYADRLATFRSWPSNNHQQPKELAKAGFFYQGHEDRVICYSCGEELSGWTPEDNAWVEHEKFHPTCKHVLQHEMGSKNLGSNENEVAEGLPAGATGDNSRSKLQHSEGNPIQEKKDTSRKKDHETVEEEIKRLRRQFQCKTCFKERVCMLILPCAHLSACALCADKLENCNVCHQPIEATVKAYCA